MIPLNPKQIKDKQLNLEQRIQVMVLWIVIDLNNNTLKIILISLDFKLSIFVHIAFYYNQRVNISAKMKSFVL